jgi:hypothetical protein
VLRSARHRTDGRGFGALLRRGFSSDRMRVSLS